MADIRPLLPSGPEGMQVSYPPRSATASRLIANFLVALGYGVLLPVLPLNPTISP